MGKIELYAVGSAGESYMGSFATYREVNSAVFQTLIRTTRKERLGKDKYRLGQAVSATFVTRLWLNVIDRSTGHTARVQRREERRATLNERNQLVTVQV